MRSSPRVVDFIVAFLQRQEVRHLFGVGGANIEDLYDALYHAPGGPLGVVAKHEFSAATMADGYHRAGQRIPVLATTSGAGAMNLVPGLAELRASYVPALALIGQPPAALDGHGSFQETSGLAGSIDAIRLFDEIAVYCARADKPESIAELLPRAWAAATDPVAPGPAVLLLPKDVQQAVLPTGQPPARMHPRKSILSRAAERAQAVALLRKAGPGGAVVIAGEGVARADARTELARVAAALGAGVAVAPDAKDVVAASSPHLLGILGAIGPERVLEAVERASLVMLVGTRLPQMTGAALRNRLKGTPVISVDPRPPFLTDRGEMVQLTGPLAEELDRLAAEFPEPPSAPAPAAAPPAPPDSSAPLNMRAAALVVSAALPEGATVVSDAGNAGASVIHHVDVPAGGRFIAAMGMAGMGHSFGAGIGAAFATGRPACVLAGDGAFFMHGMEVHTAIEHRLPVTFVVLNNNAHGMCYTREQLFFSGEYSYNLFHPARIGEGAAALFPGLSAVTVRTVGDLRTALSRAFTARRPALVCVNVDPAEMPPFQPFFQHLKAERHGLPVIQGVVPG
ncbi:thiamine pyrophosphate-binding protein [Streptomyces sp. NPDC052396]|uniref:thiamine pyrophosphate-binding protein n=1 Tax=Streptomyces sp. NPDC052396 TaxID=3365689 RepID=UPI0037CCFFDE